MGYKQTPEFTSSRMIDVNKPMHIVPPGANGRRRAVLIGINYQGQQGEDQPMNDAVGTTVTVDEESLLRHRHIFLIICGFKVN